MNKRVRVKPSKSQSIAGLLVGVIFCFIGIFLAIPTFGLFGIFWTLIAVIITVINGINAFTEKGIATHDIEINDYSSLNNEVNHVDSRKTPEERLTELKHLYEKGIITEQEYQQNRRKILDEI